MLVRCNRCGYKKRVPPLDNGVILDAGEFYGFHECGDQKIGDFIVYNYD